MRKIILVHIIFGHPTFFVHYGGMYAKWRRVVVQLVLTIHQGWAYR